MTEKCEMVCCSLVKNYCKMLHIGDKLYFSTWWCFHSAADAAVEYIKSNQIYLWYKNTDTNERSKTKSNVPTGHKGSTELH